MALGQAAGTAAHLAILRGQRLRAVDVDALQRMLLSQGQVLTYFKDIDRADPAYAGLQYFGTKGFFRDYYARSREPLERAQAAAWLRIAQPEKSGLERLLSKAPGALTTGEAANVYRALGLQKADLNPSHFDKPVTRGEFCASLYEALRSPLK